MKKIHKYLERLLDKQFRVLEMVGLLKWTLVVFITL